MEIYCITSDATDFGSWVPQSLMSACQWCMCVSGRSVAAAGVCGTVHDGVCVSAISGRWVSVSHKARRVLLLLTLRSLCVFAHWLDCSDVVRRLCGPERRERRAEGRVTLALKALHIIKRHSNSEESFKERASDFDATVHSIYCYSGREKNEGTISRLRFSKQLQTTLLLFQHMPSARERPEMEL